MAAAIRAKSRFSVISWITICCSSSAASMPVPIKKFPRLLLIVNPSGNNGIGVDIPETSDQTRSLTENKLVMLIFSLVNSTRFGIDKTTTRRQIKTIVIARQKTKIMPASCMLRKCLCKLNAKKNQNNVTKTHATTACTISQLIESGSYLKTRCGFAFDKPTGAAASIGR